MCRRGRKRRLGCLWREFCCLFAEIFSLIKSVCCKPSPGICGNRLLQLQKSANDTILLPEGFGTKSRMTAFTHSIFRAETGWKLSRITGNGERVRHVLESPAVRTELVALTARQKNTDCKVFHHLYPHIRVREH